MQNDGDSSAVEVLAPPSESNKVHHKDLIPEVVRIAYLDICPKCRYPVELYRLPLVSFS